MMLWENTYISKYEYDPISMAKKMILKSEEKSMDHENLLNKI